MGKKRIVKKGGDEGGAKGSAPAFAKKRVDSGTLYVQSTYNNTLISLGDRNGNIICASSSGALGFSGAKKSTPFAAAKVAELIAECKEAPTQRGASSSQVGGAAVRSASSAAIPGLHSARDPGECLSTGNPPATAKQLG